jgi:integrase
MATSRINTPSKIDKLTFAGEPIWEVLAKGKSLGYRKGKQSGKWVAKLASGTVRKTAVIGDGSLSYEGRTPLFRAMSYEEAREAALEWCDSLDGGSSGSYTVSQCITFYLEKLKTKRRSESSIKMTKGRLEKHIPPAMMKTPVMDLEENQIEAWMKSMVPKGADEETTRKKQDSANRVWTMLRAALNLSFKKRKVASNDGWSRVEAFEKTSASRKLYLTPKQVRELLDTTSGALHNLIQAGIYTGARLGELTAAVKGDFNGDYIELSGKTGERKCYLSKEAERFFNRMADDKLPGAPLLPSPTGEHWNKSEHSRPFKRAAQQAKLPAETCFYSLRHFHISKAKDAGLDVQLVAENVGTSIRMIEQHYGKFTEAGRRAAMDAVVLG